MNSILLTEIDSIAEVRKSDISLCPLCGKYISDVKTRRGSVISIKCPRCKKIVEITI